MGGFGLTHRALSSGIVLHPSDAATIKAMLVRGDRQHDVAAWFGVNAGRIAEIATGRKFADVEPSTNDRLPPPGPYLSGSQSVVLLTALDKARSALNDAERLLWRELAGIPEGCPTPEEAS
jgi:hypothetical protein